MRYKLLVILLFCFSAAFSQETSTIATDSIIATVYTKFMVNTMGQVKKVTAYKVDCELCDKQTIKKLKQEAVNIVSTMPAWTPTDNSIPTENMWFSLPIRIIIRND